MDDIKVLMFGWEYAPIVTGGLGVVCRDIAENLANRNIKLTFILPQLPTISDNKNIKLLSSSSTLSRQDMINYYGVESPIIPYMSYESSYSSDDPENNFLGGLYGENLFLEIKRYAANTLKIITHESFNVIHAHDWMTFPAAILAKNISKKPLIVHIHSTEYDRSNNNPYKQIVEIEQNGLNVADNIIAVSQRTKEQLISKYNIPAEKITVIYNAINCEKRFINPSKRLEAEENNEKTILFLGRLVIQKGADYLLKAAKLVLSRTNHVRFVFVGKGEMLKELIDLSIDLGIAEHVSFVGFLKHDEIDKAYRYADLFVMPSVSEPFGLTSLEAIKNGTPVIMSKQSGVAEVVPNALKVDYWDTEEMADKILAVINHAPLSSSLVENSAKDLSNINWNNQIDKLIKVYRSFL